MTRPPPRTPAAAPARLGLLGLLCLLCLLGLLPARPARALASCAPGAFLDPDWCRAAQIAVDVAWAAYGHKSYLPAGFQVLKTYRDATQGGFAMISGAGSTQTRVCYVAFRGTDSYTDAQKDLQSMVTRPCKTEQGKAFGACGDGFYDQYNALRQLGLVRYLTQEVAAGACWRLRIYGHSLGGGLASLLAAELQTVDPSQYSKQFMEVVTLGEPRPFDTSTADTFHRQVAKTRWMNWDDCIPTMPMTVMGFRHFGVARYIDYSSFWNKWSFDVQRQDFSPFWYSCGYHEIAAYNDRLQNCPGSCKACAAGSFCPGGFQEQLACGDASVFCPAGSAAAQPVSAGYYSTGGTPSTRTGQQRCPADFYCVAGVKRPCPRGSTAVAGSVQCSPAAGPDGGAPPDRGAPADGGQASTADAAPDGHRDDQGTPPAPEPGGSAGGCAVGAEPRADLRVGFWVWWGLLALLRRPRRRPRRRRPG